MKRERKLEEWIFGKEKNNQIVNVRLPPQNVELWILNFPLPTPAICRSFFSLIFILCHSLVSLFLFVQKIKKKKHIHCYIPGSPWLFYSRLEVSHCSRSTKILCIGAHWLIFLFNSWLWEIIFNQRWTSFGSITIRNEGHWRTAP